MFIKNRYKIHVYFILLLLGIVQSAFSSDLLKRLNDILGINGHPVHIITVTRGVGNLACCGIYDGYLTLPQKRFEQLMRKLREICKQEANSLKIIVFNEYFFQRLPLEEGPVFGVYGTKNDFIYRIEQESTACPNTIFYPNFLYQEASFVPNGSTEEQKKTIGAKIDSFDLDCIRSIVDSNVVKNYKTFVCENRSAPIIQSLPPLENVTTIFRNATYGIYNGRLLTEYKKSSYFKEWDFFIATGTAIYDFGTGVDQIIPALPANYSLIAQRMVQTISTEICFDLAHGIRQSNAWTNTSGSPSALHLIQSNSIFPLRGDNREHLPADKLIVHVDPMSPHSAVDTPFDSRCLIPAFFNRGKTNKLIGSDINDQEISIEEDSEIILSSPNTHDNITISVWKIS